MKGTKPIRVLIVDDDDLDIKESLAEWLRRLYNFVVDIANDGAEAMACVRKATGDYDTILMDLHLGVGPDGIETMKAIRGERADIGFIIMTGRGGVDDGIRAMQAGAFNYVFKPLNYEEIVVYILSAAERRRIFDVQVRPAKKLQAKTRAKLPAKREAGRMAVERQAKQAEAAERRRQEEREKGMPMPTGPVPRSLVADFPEQVRLAQTVSLLVSLSAEAAAGAALPIALPRGDMVDVVVQPKRGFVLEGTGEGSLVISDEEETLPLQFKLKATDLGPGKILILAFHQGQPLGTIKLTPTVVPATEAVTGQRRSHEQPMTPVSLHQPDLSLLILEHESNGQPGLTFRLTALDTSLGLNLKRFGPVLLRLDPLQYFQEFFQDIEDLPLDTPQDKARAEQRLAAKGSHLFETVIPEDLRVLLWSLRKRIRSVQVQSEEHWIPWELCKLQGRENGRVVEGPFLCEAFAITRWLPEIGLKPTLTLKKIALVVPKDSGLPLAAGERDYVLSLAKGSRQVERIPATVLELRSALAKGEYDGWHFTGHGGFRSPDPNRSAILLENQEELTPEDLSGVVENLGLARPLVFLNACQIGRGAMSLTGIGGWASKFLHAGAGAFIGAYWSIYDEAAFRFAKVLYSRLFSGSPIGQAVQDARQNIRPCGDPTWLAYTVFADPLATVA